MSKICRTCLISAMSMLLVIVNLNSVLASETNALKITSKAGIGYLILYGSQIFNLNLVISGIFILLIVSYIMYLIISHIKKY